MRSCTRLLLALLPGLAWTLPVSADLMLSGHSVTGAANMRLTSPERIWIRKATVRRDFVDRGRAYTHLFDLARRQAVIIDHGARLAELHDLSAMQAASEASAPAAGLKMSFRRTGQMRPLRHWKCEEHALEASMPARLGNEETVFHLNGRIWLAGRVKEQAEIKELVALAQKPDFFLGIPAVARISPAQSVAISEMLRRLSPQGLLCGGEVEASYEGQGPMANLARRMPNGLSATIEDFSREPIKAETFYIPPGYQLVRK
jgi:hypothetical protein